MNTLSKRSMLQPTAIGLRDYRDDIQSLLDAGALEYSAEKLPPFTQLELLSDNHEKTGFKEQRERERKKEPKKERERVKKKVPPNPPISGGIREEKTKTKTPEKNRAVIRRENLMRRERPIDMLLNHWNSTIKTVHQLQGGNAVTGRDSTIIKNLLAIYSAPQVQAMMDYFIQYAKTRFKIKERLPTIPSLWHWRADLELLTQGRDIIEADDAFTSTSEKSIPCEVCGKPATYQYRGHWLCSKQCKQRI